MNKKINDYKRNMENFKVSNSNIQKLILEHLISEGYIETADIFMKESGITTEINIKNCEIKNKIRRLLINYKIEEVFKYLEQNHKDILTKRIDIKIELSLLKFIKLIKNNQILDAIIFSRKELKGFLEFSPFYKNRILTVITLLSYQNINDFPYQFYINKSYCLKVSSLINNELNSSILKESKLDKLVKLYLWSQHYAKSNIIKVSNFTPFKVNNSINNEIIKK